MNDSHGFWRLEESHWLAEAHTARTHRSTHARWEIVRQGGSIIPVSLLPLFNLLFVSYYQNILLLLIALPAYASWRHAGTPLNRVDVLACVLCSAFLALETVADHQMWKFQVRRSRGCTLNAFFAVMD